jgi:hypothetical protein
MEGLDAGAGARRAGTVDALKAYAFAGASQIQPIRHLTRIHRNGDELKWSDSPDLGY